MALGLRDRPVARDALVDLAVPDDAAEGRHLPGRQLRRLHDGARRAGDSLLPAPDRGPSRLRRRADRRPPRLGAEVLMAAAAPYVSYSSATVAFVPAASWPLVYSSMQALKGHVQEYPGCQRLEAFVQVEPDGAVRVHCYTTWDTPEQLEVFLERGYTFERMLRDVAELGTERTYVMEKVF